MTVKLRIKWSRQEKPFILEYEKFAGVTVADLKNKIREVLQEKCTSSVVQTAQIQLSLNGKEELHVADLSELSMLGLVSGDTIHVLGLPIAIPSKFQRIQAAKQAMENGDLQTSEQSKPANKRLPLLLSECVGHEIPETLQNILLKHPTLANDTHSVVACLLHILMDESNFVPEDSDFETYPALWQWDKGTLTLKYRFPFSPENQCSLVLITMASVIVIHGTYKLLKRNLSMNLKPCTYIISCNPLLLKNLPSLSMQFKNSISYPLLVSMQQDTESSFLPASFLGLPPEIMFFILRKLDVSSIGRLAQCSKLCREFTERPLLWKYLYIRDFKTKPPTESTSFDWKKLYKEERKRRKVRLTCVVPYIPDGGVPYNPFPFVPPVIGPPDPLFQGIIGGDYDLYPQGLEPPRRRNLPNARPPPSIFGPGNPMFRHF